MKNYGIFNLYHEVLDDVPDLAPRAPQLRPLQRVPTPSCPTMRVARNVGRCGMDQTTYILVCNPRPGRPSVAITGFP